MTAPLAGAGGSTADVRARCLANVTAVRERIAAACGRAGRDPAEVRLVAVTKYVDAALTRLVHEAGCLDLAESRPQAIWIKAAALTDVAPPIRWHLIGHLQRNKIRRTLPHLSLVHSLDSLRLLEALDAEATAAESRSGRRLPIRVLLEINLAGDPGRTGATEAEAERMLTAAADHPHVDICGLMGMASVPDGDTTQARREFARLRELRDRLAARLSGGDGLPELSMGMSGDFEAAILEGSTLVRIGSTLFEGLDREA
jgi:pyridoxal phosphate enzyme (YggS family)